MSKIKFYNTNQYEVLNQIVSFRAKKDKELNLL